MNFWGALHLRSAGVFDYDRSKLLFSTRYASMTGSELAQILLEKYHIQVEMETEHYVLALAAVGDSEEGFERLCQAIEEIDQEEAQKKKEKRELRREAPRLLLHKAFQIFYCNLRS